MPRCFTRSMGQYRTDSSESDDEPTPPPRSLPPRSRTAGKKKKTVGRPKKPSTAKKSDEPDYSKMSIMTRYALCKRQSHDGIIRPNYGLVFVDPEKLQTDYPLDGRLTSLKRKKKTNSSSQNSTSSNTVKTLVARKKSSTRNTGTSTSVKSSETSKNTQSMSDLPQFTNNDKENASNNPLPHTITSGDAAKTLKIPQYSTLSSTQKPNNRHQTMGSPSTASTSNLSGSSDARGRLYYILEPLNIRNNTELPVPPLATISPYTSGSFVVPGRVCRNVPGHSGLPQTAKFHTIPVSYNHSQVVGSQNATGTHRPAHNLPTTSMSGATATHHGLPQAAPYKHASTSGDLLYANDMRNRAPTRAAPQASSGFTSNVSTYSATQEINYSNVMQEFYLTAPPFNTNTYRSREAMEHRSMTSTHSLHQDLAARHTAVCNYQESTSQYTAISNVHPSTATSSNAGPIVRTPQAVLPRFVRTHDQAPMTSMPNNTITIDRHQYVVIYETRQAFSGGISVEFRDNLMSTNAETSYRDREN